MNKGGRIWLAFQDFSDGMGLKEIAMKYGVAQGTVRNWKNRHWRKAEEQSNTYINLFVGALDEREQAYLTDYEIDKAEEYAKMIKMCDLKTAELLKLVRKEKERATDGGKAGELMKYENEIQRYTKIKLNCLEALVKFDVRHKKGKEKEECQNFEEDYISSWLEATRTSETEIAGVFDIGDDEECLR